MTDLEKADRLIDLMYINPPNQPLDRILRRALKGATEDHRNASEHENDIRDKLAVAIVETVRTGAELSALIGHFEAKGLLDL